MSALTRIQAAVREVCYQISEHALEEAEDDGFSEFDVEHAILHGDLVKRYTHDPRGTRYEICGTALDGRLLYVVGRFTEAGRYRILTVYSEMQSR